MTKIIIDIIKSIPPGKVSTYGRIGEQAGLRSGARRVARILHSCSGKYDLPWHRVVRSNGEIALKEMGGAEEQRTLLLAEGVIFKSEYCVDLKKSLFIGFE